MLLSLETEVGDVIGIVAGLIMVGCIVAGVVALSVMGYRELRRKGPD